MSKKKGGRRKPKKADRYSAIQWYVNRIHNEALELYWNDESFDYIKKCLDRTLDCLKDSDKYIPPPKCECECDCCKDCDDRKPVDPEGEETSEDACIWECRGLKCRPTCGI